MDITKMKKKDFAAVPYLDLYKDWDKLITNGKLEFDSFVIIPVEDDDHNIELHDSGYGCMEFCLIKDNEPIGKIGGGSDVIEIDGIGGYGYNWAERCYGIPRTVSVHGWIIDLLPCGYLNVWTRRKLFLADKFVGSTFEVYSEDEYKKEE